MAERFCRTCRGWHKTDAWPSECIPRREVKRSTIGLPYFICDTMEPTQSMADGKWYTSKSAIRATYRPEGNPHGVQFNELGNEDTTTFNPPKRDKKADREAIERAIADVESGNAPPVLTTDQIGA